MKLIYALSLFAALTVSHATAFAYDVGCSMASYSYELIDEKYTAGQTKVVQTIKGSEIKAGDVASKLVHGVITTDTKENENVTEAQALEIFAETAGRIVELDVKTEKKSGRMYMVVYEPYNSESGWIFEKTTLENGSTQFEPVARVADKALYSCGF